ncbi:hypothetical protein [Roseomonas sp. CECT 9278]|uniref:AbrB/MazE/SpoVT family DNA-binding domain-containing protein n=1 Tax=Roseomonas sp. CECT 9278 TaxID=2845823 RepID=UPI001E5E5452|nr:hypothetical protein [Roseomonas sp. CECT 9278]CAH0137544.1 hypothetical protein ROS9278_00393 [Roseomonas sp. CECT 9278]
MAGAARGAAQDALHAKPEAITRVTVKKWGNSAAVRIPGSVMVAARVSLDQAVEVRAEDRRSEYS